MTYPIITLLPKQGRRLRHGYPWVYANEIAITPAAKALEPGSLVIIADHESRPLGVGYFNVHSLIAARLLSNDPTSDITRLLQQRLSAALKLRCDLFPGSNFYRLVHAEGDHLPGLIIDRYGDIVVAQLGTAGMEKLWPAVEGILLKLLNPRAIVLRNDVPSRQHEQLPLSTRLAHGVVEGTVRVEENGVSYVVDLLEGQKTGWFFDHRANRARLAQLAKGKEVLDVFCHSGGFALAAAKAGAAAINGVDESKLALEMAAQGAIENKISVPALWHQGSAFKTLEQWKEEGKSFDIVIADPPAFAPARKDVPKAKRAYRKLAHLAADVTRPHGYLFLACCSYHLTPETFFDEIA
ncbi:MAG: class I SAM-dependent rRNA methyltransferase, partial [Dongiaceae bacterium]